MTRLAPLRGDVEVLRVVVVEDNDGDARLVELMLRESFGPELELTRARTLAQALACIDWSPGGCMLLDLGLPDASGLEAVQSIMERAPATPIVVLTGQADGDIGMQAVAAGAQDYLVKGAAKANTLGRAIRYAIVRKDAEDALVRSEQALAEAQRIAQLGSWELDLVTSEMVWSEELCRLFGFNVAVVPSFEDILLCVHMDDREPVRELLLAALAGPHAFDVDHRIVLGEGVERWLRCQGRVEFDAGGVAVGMRGTAQDITEQKRSELALAHQALHDPLTGLPNRSLLLDRLSQALVKLERNPLAVALLFIDIDRFKVVNDSLGHPAGDQILLAMTARLQGTLRAGDTLARFGGDEFVILCEGLSGEDEALALAQRIGDAMADPLHLNENELVVTVSTGIALATSHLVSAESLLRDADAAMYRAKDNGRARAAVFADSMREKAVGRLNTEVSLRRAIVEGEFELHYQPIVELPSRRIVGAEALVRWQHPAHGLIAPDQFIPIAEETGLIVPLGAWVLREATRQASSWLDLRSGEEFTIAVNLSGVQIAQPDLVELVACALHLSGLRAASLELEITESVLMKDAASAVRILNDLKALGVRLSVDDFGTGYSSLSYLKRFPVDVLKVDRSFVDGLGVDAEDSAIVRAITSLATALNLTTIAEGVETEQQLRHLIDLECGLAQGCYFSRPVPAADFERLLDAPAVQA